VTADKIDVSNLSAISANIGVITAGKIYADVLIGKNGTVYAPADSIQAAVARALGYIDSTGYFKGKIGINTAYVEASNKYQIELYSSGGIYYLIANEAGGGNGTGDEPANTNPNYP
jgi:hypothetical protein